MTLPDGRHSVDSAEFALIVESIDGKLDALILQTTVTNGRVTKLEMRQAFLGGGLAVLGVFAAATVPLVATLTR